MKQENYTNADIEYLQNKFRKLYIAIANQKLNPNTQTLKDQLASISRILVWDDQHNTDLFEYFPPHLVSSARSKC